MLFRCRSFALESLNATQQGGGHKVGLSLTGKTGIPGGSLCFDLFKKKPQLFHIGGLRTHKSRQHVAKPLGLCFDSGLYQLTCTH